jgi:hypothetical protein
MARKQTREGPMNARERQKAQARKLDMQEAEKGEAARTRLQKRNSIFPEEAVKKMIIHW